MKKNKEITGPDNPELSSAVAFEILLIALVNCFHVLQPKNCNKIKAQILGAAKFHLEQLSVYNTFEKQELLKV